ncbi:zinc knuckle domain-containing protein [Toxoplasma gondii ARI]|uniref:Zinc knuckle domain-containing protein n=1 Tax=Toxoplasma gondii ARI TaxID=1074872 RepID=A0A139XMZ3_TOXGO|nr:zinc knuckle domain-containing protein [Toxoplasma gondii ARI]
MQWNFVSLAAFLPLFSTLSPLPCDLCRLWVLSSSPLHSAAVSVRACCSAVGGPASGGGPNYSWAQGPFPGAFAPPVWGQHSGSIGPGSSPGASDAGGAARPAAGGRGGFEPWGFSGASGAPQEPHSGAASGTGPFPPLPMAPAGAPPPAPDADDGLDKNDDDNMDMND